MSEEFPETKVEQTTLRRVGSDIISSSRGSSLRQDRIHQGSAAMQQEQQQQQQHHSGQDILDEIISQVDRDRPRSSIKKQRIDEQEDTISRTVPKRRVSFGAPLGEKTIKCESSKEKSKGKVLPINYDDTQSKSYESRNNNSSKLPYRNQEEEEEEEEDVVMPVAKDSMKRATGTVTANDRSSSSSSSAVDDVLGGFGVDGDEDDGKINDCNSNSDRAGCSDGEDDIQDTTFHVDFYVFKFNPKIPRYRQSTQKPRHLQQQQQQLTETNTATTTFPNDDGDYDEEEPVLAKLLTDGDEDEKVGMRGNIESPQSNSLSEKNFPASLKTGREMSALAATTGGSSAPESTAFSVPSKTDTEGPTTADAAKGTAVGCSEDDAEGGKGKEKGEEEALSDEGSPAKSKWRPPTLKGAKLYRKHKLFRGGDADLAGAKIMNEPELSFGISLYFQFVYGVTISLCVMSLLSLPAIMFCYFGKNITTMEQDANELYKFTLGNIGYDRNNINYYNNSLCTDSRLVGINDTCINYLPFEVELSFGETQWLLTICEGLQIFVFFFAIYYLKGKFDLAQDKARLQTSITDYSIMVEHLPPKTTKEELINHFSYLYQLEQEDWQGRLPVETCEVVKNVEHTKDKSHAGSWVAECTVHTKIGKIIESFKSHQDLMQLKQSAEAQMKMYGPNSNHRGGPNPKKFKKAEKNVEKFTKKLGERSKEIVSKLDISADSEHYETIAKLYGMVNAESAVSVSEAFLANEEQMTELVLECIHAEPVTAFITFENNESYARCMEDFERYQKWPYTWLCYPDELKFRGKKLKVSQAPEPDQILWENLQVSETSKACAGWITLLISFVVVTISFVIILQGSLTTAYFKDLIPNTKICDYTIPALYSDADTSVADYQYMSFIRPTGSEKTTQDERCNELYANSFYATLTYENKEHEIDDIITYDFAACSSSSSSGTAAADLCPEYESESFCPCISTEAEQKCPAKECATGETTDCIRFQASNIGACYCFEYMAANIEEKGFYASFSLLNAKDEPACGEFLRTYIVANTYSAVGSLITVVVNIVLKFILIFLSKKEYHNFMEEERGSMMRKLFLANYMVLVLTVIVSNMHVWGVPNWITENFRLFTGGYATTNRQWFAAVGQTFVVTLAAQILTVPMTGLAMSCIVQPLLQWYHRRKVKRMTTHSMILQSDLNKLYVGPEFDISVQGAALLSFLFITFTFAPGVPVMTPLCCLGFLLYFNVDKFLVYRYFLKPGEWTESTMLIVYKWLPWAVLLRLAIACWIYGDAELLPNPNKIDLVVKARETVLDKRQFLPYAAEVCILRVLRDRVVPLFLFFLIVAFVMAFREFLRSKAAKIVTAPIKLVLLPFVCVSNVLSGGQSGKYESATAQDGYLSLYNLSMLEDPLRQEVAPYTQTYYQFIHDSNAGRDTGGKSEKKMFSDMARMEESNEISFFAKIGGCLYFLCCCKYVVRFFTRERAEELTREEREEGWKLVEAPDGKHNAKMKTKYDDFQLEVQKAAALEDEEADLEQGCLNRLLFGKASDQNKKYGFQRIQRTTSRFAAKKAKEALEKQEFKKTYEVIEDHRINTFRMLKIPAYRQAIEQLVISAVTTLKRKIERDEDDADTGLGAATKAFIKRKAAGITSKLDKQASKLRKKAQKEAEKAAAAALSQSGIAAVAAATIAVMGTFISLKWLQVKNAISGAVRATGSAVGTAARMAAKGVMAMGAGLTAAISGALEKMTKKKSEEGEEEEKIRRRLAAVNIQKVYRSHHYRKIARKKFVATYTKQTDVQSGLPFYTNNISGESSWSRPRMTQRFFKNSNW